MTEIMVGWTGEKPSIRGCIRFRCEMCQSYIWLAPSGQRMFAAGLTVLCRPCAESVAEGCDVEYEFPPGLAEEIVQAILHYRQRN